VSEWSLPDPARRVHSVPEPRPPARATPAATAEPSPRRPVAPAVDRAQSSSGWLLLVGGGLVVLGSVLPWSVVTTSRHVLSADGLRGDGRVTLVLGLIVAAIGLRALLATVRRSMVVVALVAASVAAVVAGFNAFDLETLGTAADQLASLNVGHGLLLTAIGGIVAVIGSVRLVASTHHPS